MIQRTLVFSSDPIVAARRFSLLYQGFLTAGSVAPGGPKPLAVLRLEVTLLDQLDAISDLSETDPTGRSLRCAVAELRLSQPAWKLLRDRMEQTGWITSAARHVVDTIDWLDAAPTTDTP